MLNRNYIEKILRLNGITPTSPDEEIKSVLLSAQWHKADVETALTVFRKNTHTHEDRVETKRNIFMSDEKLAPETIQALLGIEVDLSSSDLEKLQYSRKHISILQIIGILGFAVIFALCLILSVMWQSGIGIFYPLP